MQEAIRLAVENVRSGNGGPFGAVVVKNGEIVAGGANQVTATSDPTAHAEVVAIRAAAVKLNNFVLSGCEMYASCEPCPMCLAAIYWARMDRIYFAASRQDAAKAGFDDQVLYDEVGLPLEKRSLPISTCCSEIGGKPFAEWAKMASRIPY